VTVTADVGTAAGEQARAAARLRGATQALNVLGRRSPVEQQRASLFAVSLLRTAAPADWTEAGLPDPPVAAPAADAGQPPGPGLPADHRAVVLLAQAAMDLYAAGRRISERPGLWDHLTGFFAGLLPEDDPELAGLRERVLTARTNAGDTSPELFAELADALEYHRAVHGQDAYLTSVAQVNLAVAFRLRRAGNDLAASTALAGEAARLRAAAYGPEHPVTLEARSMVNHSMLLQAETSPDDERPRIASQVLPEAIAVRAARDRLYGITAPNATSSRRHEARALLLLGEPGRARQSLELALACETAHNGAHESRTMADTHQLLAKVYRDLGDLDGALQHAREASRIFDLHNPEGRAAKQARRLIAELSVDGGAGG
jgi:tetratricopeptide (TPR) repeat protein